MVDCKVPEQWSDRNANDLTSMSEKGSVGDFDGGTDSGAYFEALDAAGKKALLLESARCGRTDVVEDADKDSIQKYGFMAMLVASNHGHMDVVEVLRSVASAPVTEWSNGSLRNALMDVGLVSLIGSYAAVGIKHPENNSNRRVCDAPVTRFQATHRWTVFSGTWDWMWKMKAHSGWAHSWAYGTRVLMGEEATAPVCEMGIGCAL